MMFLEGDIVLADAPMPYRMLPIFRIVPGDILGTPYGYTPMFDILPMQEAINSIYSTVLTNQNAFGVQNIYVPRGADISVNQLEGGLNVIEGNQQAGKPESLNLTHTPEEIFKFMQILEQSAETISGVNSVARGNPEASLKSGTALALVQSMTLQFLSGLQQSYVELVEDVGTALIKLLQDFAAVPRVAAIVGKSNKTYLKEFKGDDLESINRVVVDVGNPLARTTAGRVQMAEQMLQMQLITTPEQYMSVINTGKLENMTEGTTKELFSIREENERMMAGDEVPVIVTDRHSIHILEHKSILSDPDLRKDPALVKNMLAHFEAHLNELRGADPGLLSLIGEQSMAPAQGSPPAPMMPPNTPEGQGAPSGQMQPPQEVMTAEGQAPLPNMPQPPGEFADLPVTADQMIPGGGG